MGSLQEQHMPESNEDTASGAAWHRRSVDPVICAMTGCWKSRPGWSTPSPLFSMNAIAACQPGEPVHDISLRLAIDDRMTIIEAATTMRSTPYPHYRSRADIAAPGRRAHRQGMARTGAPEIGRSRPAPIPRTARSGGNGALSDHVLRGPGEAQRPGRSAQQPANGRSLLAAVIPGQPTAPSSPRCFRNSRPSPRATTKRSQAELSRPSEPLQIRPGLRSDWCPEYPTDIRLPGPGP